MSNPFFYGGMIKDARYFVGRQEELARIFASLATLPEGQAQHVSVYGPYRIGKSSLLYRVSQVCAAHGLQGHPCLYLDGQKFAAPQDFFAALLRGLGASGEPTRTAVEEALRRLPRLPVLLLDEVDHLARPQGDFTNDFFDLLRAWMNTSLLAVVAASRRPLPEIARGTPLTSPFFNIFGTVVALGPFSEAEADALLARGRRSDRPFTNEEVQRIKDWARERARLDGETRAGYHPAKLQLAARELYEAKARSPVDGHTLERALERQWHKNILGEPSPRSRLSRAAGRVWSWPEPLGRGVLEMLGRSQISPFTARLVGWLIMLAVLAVLTGFLPWKALLAWLLR